MTWLKANRKKILREASGVSLIFAHTGAPALCAEECFPSIDSLDRR
jgi:hypothetical protein